MATASMNAPRLRNCGPAWRYAKAFTLIELLVVISIIALLIAILLPNLAAARETARQIDCATRLRQLALAAEVYANEEKEFFPARNMEYPRGSGTRIHWPKMLVRHYQSGDLLVCPSDGLDPASEPDPDAANNGDHSYFFNGWNDVYDLTKDNVLYNDNYTNDWAMSRKLIKQPSETILFGEKKTFSTHFYMDLNEGMSGNEFTQLEQARHGGSTGGTGGNGASNYAFADGSTRNFRFPEAIQPVNYWAVFEVYRDTSALTPTF